MEFLQKLSSLMRDACLDALERNANDCCSVGITAWDAQAHVPAWRFRWAGMGAGSWFPFTTNPACFRPPPRLKASKGRDGLGVPSGLSRPLFRRNENHDNGKVQAWLADKGYGFIRPDDGLSDVFVHMSALPLGELYLTVGTRVSFDIEPGRHDRMQAFNVRLL